MGADGQQGARPPFICGQSFVRPGPCAPLIQGLAGTIAVSRITR